ncbi:MAG: tetratricopeptide repeat protein [Acidobacteriota bacterium]
MERALAIRRQTLGAGHPTIPWSLGILGDFARDAGDLRLAETYFREALELRRVPDRDVDLRRAETALDLAEVLSELGDAGDVEALLTEAETVLPTSEDDSEVELRTRITELRRRSR